MVDVVEIQNEQRRLLWNRDMNRAPDIIFVGEFQFPEGDAGALRVLGIGRALRDAGFNVLFIGRNQPGRPEDVQADGSYAYQGFPYLAGSDFCDGRLARLKRGILTHVLGSTAIHRLLSLDTRNLRAIITYHGCTALLWRLRTLCRKWKIALITDTVEWHNPEHVAGGRRGCLYWDNQLRLRWMTPKISHAIAISTFLQHYYETRGCHTIRVPAVIDVGTGSPQGTIAPAGPCETPEELRLLFTGAPDRERWDAILAGVQLVRQAGRKIRLDVFGSSRKCRVGK